MNPMIKQIKLSELRVGMYVHVSNSSWMKSPSGSKAFEIKTKEQIQTIQKTGVQELFIDTVKGIDLDEPDTTNNPDKIEEPRASNIKEESFQARSLEEELGHAAKVKKNASKIVSKIMNDAQLGHPIELGQASALVEGMLESTIRNKDALIGLTRIRQLDKYNLEHSVSTSILLTAFCWHLNLPLEDVIQVGLGGFLCDIGKLKVPQNILTKPGELTDQEHEIIKKHVNYGLEMLENISEVTDIILDITRDHHERIDGSGYPEGKSGDDISMYGQIAAIVDTYDALTSNRVYKKRISPSQALKKLVSLGNSLFDSELVQNFIHFIGVYPIGTLVSLSDGNFAVVIESSNESLSPKVRVIFNSIKRSFLTPKDLELSNMQAGKGLKIVGAVDPEKWRIDPANFLPHRDY